MERRRLGSSGIAVPPVGLGAMPMSLTGRPPEADSVKVIHASLDAGVELIDTADVYCLGQGDIGHNERLVARALREWRGDRTRITVATKGGLERPGGAWTSNARPDHLRAACDASLKALGVEAIALYQLHAPDDRVPFADSVGALAELRGAGKIQHVGLSNVTVDEIRVAQAIVPVVSVQNRCSLFDREPFEDGVVDHCVAEGIALLAYSPVGGSHGKARVTASAELRTIGARRSVSPFQVALAWLLARSPAIVPIPGASKVASAVDSAAAATLSLTVEELQQLNTLAA